MILLRGFADGHRAHPFSGPRSGSAITATTRPLHAFDKSAAKLGTGQLDLPILHQPLPSAFDRTIGAYKALERLLADGKVRAIGVSDFMPEHLSRLLEATDIVPAVNQVELHPYFTQPGVQKATADHGILTHAWSPIGGITFYRGSGKSTLQDPAILALADGHGKTAAQVMLRWHLQRGRSTRSTPAYAAALTQVSSPLRSSAGQSPKPERKTASAGASLRAALADVPPPDHSPWPGRQELTCPVSALISLPQPSSTASVRFLRQAWSYAVRPAADAEGLEKVLAGVSIYTSAFVEKVSGSRPGCP